MLTKLTMITLITLGGAACGQRLTAIIRRWAPRANYHAGLHGSVNQAVPGSNYDRDTTKRLSRCENTGSRGNEAPHLRDWTVSVITLTPHCLLVNK